MTFGPVDPQINFVSLENKVLETWKSIELLEQVKQQRQDAPRWTFYEGPPTANGRPGLHHVWARAFKDLFVRFKTMQGYLVSRKGGWDCHGLPVEIEVEKQLGLSSKTDIEKVGIGFFNERCRESVQRYVSDWVALTERAGVWIDSQDAYWTMSNSYIESVWWILHKLWDEELLYEGYRVSPYCPRCGTVLSSHELAQGFKDITDDSVFVRFPLVDIEADLLVWTTTPWTLVSNVAVAIGPDMEYVQYKSEDGFRDLICAKTLVPEDAQIVAYYKAEDLVGKLYKRPFEDLKLKQAPHVVTADFVSTEEGSGLVHISPAFGTEDMQLAEEKNLEVLNPIGPDGLFDSSVRFSGQGAREVNPQIIEDLASRSLLVKVMSFNHSYPHCWRCDTPLIYWARTSWFLRTSANRETLLSENERIGWHPEYIKHGRFGDWLENNIDWTLSRDRYWGTPIPIWKCEDGHLFCVGSVEELSQLSGKDLTELDLHRPFVDEITFPCQEVDCSFTAKRIQPVLDAWFDSGSMPLAQFHYPFEGPQSLEEVFPADFICEAIDQTRGWFYSLLAVNSLAFGSTPYLNVVCLAHVVDENGLKMSKSRGNVVDPWQAFSEFGADSLRWYFYYGGSPWVNRRIDEESIKEASRKTLVTLWNVYSFFATYADLENWTPPKVQANQNQCHVLDRWILQELRQSVDLVTKSMEAFDSLNAAQAIAKFIDDLSNWYVRRSRPRFWSSEDPCAFATLYKCLVVTSQLLAPFAPFISETIYTNLTNQQSVHLSSWPQLKDFELPLPSDNELLEQMDVARKLVVLGRAARSQGKSKIRQPLKRAVLVHPGISLSKEIKDEIAIELNVKSLEDVDNIAGLVSWTIIPNFKILGPKLGAAVNEVKQALAKADGNLLKQSFDENGFIEISGFRLEPDEVEIRASSHENLTLVQQGSWAVALDLELNEDLILEAFARELSRDINDLRKQKGFEIADRILVEVFGDPKLELVLKRHGNWIEHEILAAKPIVLKDSPADFTDQINIDGQSVYIKISKVEQN